MYRLFLYDRRQLGSDNQSEWSARPRHKGYNRSCTLRQSLRQFDLRYLPQPNPNFRPKSHNHSRPLVTLISTNHPPHRGAYRATKRVTDFAGHLPLARSGRIVHYSPLCLQIEWTDPYKRQRVWGIRLPRPLSGCTTGRIALILQTAEKFMLPDMYQCLLYNVFRGIGYGKFCYMQ